MLSSKDDILREYKKETTDVVKSGDKRETPDVVKSAAELEARSTSKKQAGCDSSVEPQDNYSYSMQNKNAMHQKCMAFLLHILGVCGKI